MDDLISEFLKNIPTFHSLDDDEKKSLREKLVRVELKEDEILFKQGESSDFVYILLQGKLSATLATANDTRIVGYIGPGETVGEIGALTNVPRTLTIKAVADCVLLELASDDFIHVCKKHPDILIAILQPLLTRTSTLIQLLSTEESEKNIVLVPANNSISLQEFAHNLQRYVNEFSDVLIISDYEQMFHSKMMTMDQVKEKILAQIAEKKSVKTILYLLNGKDTLLAEYAHNHADTVYLVAQFDSKTEIDKHLLDNIKTKKSNDCAKPNLIILYKDETTTPINTINWLKLFDFNLHHHVRINNKDDLLRLFRFIRGKAVGVVLSGGGTRGWAHLGAIKAIRESNIPIDIIGGASVGGLAAGCYAMSQRYDGAYELFKRLVIDSTNTISWRGLTFPIISLYSAKNYTYALEKAFDKQQIEDLWLPYFCVSTNLANNTEFIHQTGTLWEVIRASTAIPGLIPPMLINDELHADGGLINNFPIDIMRQFIGPNGRVIAIELNNSYIDKNKYFFPPVLGLWTSILIKLGVKKSDYKFPKFVNTFMRSLTVGSELKTRQNALLANTHVSLNVDKFKMLHSGPAEGLRLIKIGFDETLKKL